MVILRNIFDWLWHEKLGRPYKLTYVTYGRGRKPLLLLHGLASSGEIWRPLTRLTDGKWKIIAPDLLGFGGSPSPSWNNYDVSQHAKHVIALLNRLRIQEPLTIVAHSMGCLVATHIAYMHPDRVERVILYEPPLLADVPNYKAHQRVRERYLAMFNYVITHPQLMFKDGNLRKIWTRIGGIGVRPETWIPFERSIKNTIMKQSAYDELHTLKVPTTIVHGRLDIVVPRADVRKMLQSNPFIKFHTINRMHGISPRAARELVRLLQQ
ncbi:MAG: alpha/beta hydrolase [Candidatus Saccharibacteria bacterium]|nr:alpha/beta hydrolase [Candidatus Saccharibacteria bacterium]